MFKLKKFISSLLILAIVILVLPLSASAIETQDNATSSMTSEEYVQWVKDFGGTDANKSLDQFNSLTQKNKQKFLEYLSNEDVINNIFKTMTQSSEKVSDISLYNGDVIISSSENTKKLNEVKSSRGTVAMVGTYKRNAKILGIVMFETTSKVTYYVRNSSTVTSIIGYNHYVSKNYDPLLNVSLSGMCGWISNNKAHSSADMSWAFVVQGITTFASGTVTVWGGPKYCGGSYVQY